MSTWDQQWLQASADGDISAMQELVNSLIFETLPRSLEATLAMKMKEALTAPKVVEAPELEVLLSETFATVSGSMCDLDSILTTLEEVFPRIRDPYARFVTAVQIRETSTPAGGLRRLVRLMERVPRIEAGVLQHEAELCAQSMSESQRAPLEKRGPLPNDVEGWIAILRDDGSLGE